MPIARVMRIPLVSSLSGTEALRALRGQPMLVALLGKWADSRALISSYPIGVADADADPFAVFDNQPFTGSETCDAGAVGGGWFGYLGYQLGRDVEHLDAPPPRPDPFPLFHLAFYDHVIRLDTRGQWWFEALETESRSSRLRRRCRQVQRLMAASPAAGSYSFSPWGSTPGGAAHSMAVAACRERIARGDLYQANLSLRMHSHLSGDMLDVFCDGFTALHPDKAAFISAPWGAIASLSPELFLRRRGNDVWSAPIKGTRAIPKDQNEAIRIDEELERSEKDRAEHVMIVDLMRNDLGRVCRHGSVAVEVLARARRQAGVSNLVSEISGRLAPATSNSELLRATFPPGSVTGAPKVAAVNVIAELESTCREVYTGAIGFASPRAGLELNVAIRTLEARRGAVWMGVGGGVVADSTPGGEAAEVATKARPVLEAIGASPAELPSLRSPGSIRRRDGAPVPRPNPACGVFETMLVASSSVPHVEQHLNRLAASVSELYDLALPDDMGSKILHAAADYERARLRVTAIPGGAELGHEIDVRQLNFPLKPFAPVSVECATVPGGIGAHKWCDRRLIDALGAGPGYLALMCDLDGYVLEAARANVFALRGPCLITPPLDGRILPGTTRRRVIEHAHHIGLETEERPLHHTALLEADEVFLTSALRRVEPVEMVDGHPLSSTSGVAARLWEMDNQVERARRVPSPLTA